MNFCLVCVNATNQITDMANVVHKTLFIELSTEPESKVSVLNFSLYFLHVYQHKVHLLCFPEKLYHIGAACQAIAGPFF